MLPTSAHMEPDEIIKQGITDPGVLERLRLGLGDGLDKLMYGAVGEVPPPAKLKIINELLRQNPLQRAINPTPIPNPNPALTYPSTGGVRG